MKKLAFMIFGLTQTTVFAQNGMMQNTKDALNLGGLKVGQHSSTMLYGFDTRTTEVLGTYYLDPNWSVATVRFYPRTLSTPTGTVKLDSLTDVQIKIVLYGNEVEFNTPEGVKIISGSLIKSFTLQQPNQEYHHFISTSEFVDNFDKIKPSFLEVLADGKLKLLEYTKVTIQKPDYVEAFNTGSKDIKINKEKQLFVNQGNEIIKLRINRKSILALMADKQNEIEAFVKQNNLFVKDRQDLIKIFKFYNAQ
ncbi:MAG: hypothetical protein ACOVO2_18290 [Emticicia sp.]